MYSSRFEHLDGDTNSAILRHPAFGEDLAQQSAIAPLHHHVNARALFAAEHAHHHGVIELLANFRFALEAIEENRIGFHVGVWNFQGDDTIVPRIHGAKNRSHTASRDRRFNAVRVDLSNQFRWCRGCPWGGVLQCLCFFYCIEFRGLDCKDFVRLRGDVQEGSR